MDFYCAERGLIIEVDGPIHENTPEEDAIRQAYLESLGLHIERETNEDVFDNLEGVAEYIHHLLTE